jgi:hypothetical protein
MKSGQCIGWRQKRQTILISRDRSHRIETNLGEVIHVLRRRRDLHLAEYDCAEQDDERDFGRR